MPHDRRVPWTRLVLFVPALAALLGAAPLASAQAIGCEESPPPPDATGRCRIDLLLKSVSLSAPSFDHQALPDKWDLPTLEGAALTFTGARLGLPQAPLDEGWGNDTDLEFGATFNPHKVLDFVMVSSIGGPMDYEICVDVAASVAPDGSLNPAATACSVLSLSCPMLTASTQLVVKFPGAAVGAPDGFELLVDIEAMPHDMDGDGVENEIDWTADLCDEARLGTGGEALLHYFYYEEEKEMYEAVQAYGINLNKADDGTYAATHVMLDGDADLTWIQDDNPLGYTSPMEHYDTWSEPSEQGFFGTLRQFVEAHYNITILIHAHGSDNQFETKIDDETDPTSDEQADITAQEVRDTLAQSATGTSVIPIRMVWSGSCDFSTMNDAFHDAGAVTVSGALETNFYPNFYGPFIDEWNDDETYGVSVANSGTAWQRFLSHSFMEGLGLDFGCTPRWSGGPGTVTRANDCAHDFFTIDPVLCPEPNVEDGVCDDAWGYTSIPWSMYVPLATGIDNMDTSSERITLGDLDLRRSTPLTW